MPHSSIPAIVLAAGRSSRMGEPKATLRLPGGQSFLGRILLGLVSGGASPVVVVIAPDDLSTEGAVPPELRDVVRVAVNPQPERGQLSSLQCGLGSVAGASAFVVTLVDVPLVDSRVVAGLIDAWRTAQAPLVRPAREGRHGHPMLVGQPLVAELLAADPTTSARTIVRRHAAGGIELEVQDDGPFTDVDTPAEYRQLLARLQERRDR